MCIAFPGKVEEVNRLSAVVDYGTEKRKAVLTGEIPVKKGDYVLVQMGCVVQKLTRKEADESLKAWKSARMSANGSND